MPETFNINTKQQCKARKTYISSAEKPPNSISAQTHVMDSDYKSFKHEGVSLGVTLQPYPRILQSITVQLQSKDGDNLNNHISISVWLFRHHQPHCNQIANLSEKRKRQGYKMAPPMQTLKTKAENKNHNPSMIESSLLISPWTQGTKGQHIINRDKNE